MISNDSFKQLFLMHMSQAYNVLPKQILSMRIDLLSGTMPTEAEFKQLMPTDGLEYVTEFSNTLVNNGAVRHGSSNISNAEGLHGNVGTDWKKRVLRLYKHKVKVTASGVPTNMLIQFSDLASPSRTVFAFLLTISDEQGTGEVKFKNTSLIEGTYIRLPKLTLDYTSTFVGGTL